MFFVSGISTNPYINLATEEVLHRKSTKEFCMLWQNEASVIVGRCQNALEEIDRKFVEDHNIPVVRRMTGGGAVFHDMGNLNFSYIVNGGEFGDWEGFTKMLREYLAALGVSAHLSGRNDVLVDGRKISGNAQCVYHDRLLHHGTILVSADMSFLSRALKPDAEKIKSAGIKSAPSRVVNINEFADISIDAFRKGFESFLRTNMKLEEYILGEDELSEIYNLAETKYKTYEWNYGYSPKYTFHKKKRFSGGSVEVFMNVENGIIRSADICGDFFAKNDIDVLKEVLCGKKHTEADISAAMRSVWQEGMLGTVTIEELLSCFE